jgi:beta-lactamase class A
MKLPLVAAVHNAARAGAIDLDARVRAGDLPATSYRSVLAAFDPDHEFSLRELCALCLVTSDNPIADHLLGRVGMRAVNRQAALWGCRTTRLTVGFADNFLGDAGRANVTTVRDALLMIRALMRGPLRLEVMRPLAHNLRNFRIPLRLPEDLEVPHKTGSLGAVANDVGAVLGVRSDVAVAFLCDEQVDTARTSVEIGDCVAKVWSALGEELD